MTQKARCRATSPVSACSSGPSAQEPGSPHAAGHNGPASSEMATAQPKLPLSERIGTAAGLIDCSLKTSATSKTWTHPAFWAPTTIVSPVMATPSPNRALRGDLGCLPAIVSRRFQCHRHRHLPNCPGNVRQPQRCCRRRLKPRVRRTQRGGRDWRATTQSARSIQHRSNR